MTYDKEKYLSYLEQYLSYSGIQINKEGKVKCFNPHNHTRGDKKSSAQFYEHNKKGEYHPHVTCMICDYDGDIYDIAGELNHTKVFKEQYEIIENIYGSISDSTPPASKKNVEKKPDEEIKLVSLSKEKAKKVYTIEKINKVRSFSKSEVIKSGKQVNSWIYTDVNGDVIAADIRFEKIVEKASGEKQTEKTTITFWYNGKSLKFTGKFNIIYNLHESLNTDLPILIHEGAKCAKLGIDNIDGLCHVSYNRGAKNSDKVDWTIYNDKTVYILQDNDSEGFKAAKKIQSKIPHAILLKTIYKHFEIDDKKKSDIEQLLEQDNAENITKFILSYTEEVEQKIIKTSHPVCLGIDDNNYVHFIDRFQRLYELRRDGISKKTLMVISNLDYWYANFSTDKGAIIWDDAVEYILGRSEDLEFDHDKIRGRGAWKDNGNYLYHDGKTTHGKQSGEFMYIRKNKRDIGVNDTPADFAITAKLRELCSNITFENETDIIRLLGWSLISPFSGALFWRPAILMTGESGSGKSTVLEKMVLTISAALHCNTHSTSEAGLRAKVGNDSCAVCLDEAEGSGNNNDFQKDNHRNNLFNIMRASSSDDAPDGYKSNKDQKSIRYSMKNMFLFVSITPTIADAADANRIFKVNFVKPEKKVLTRKWEDVEEELVELLSVKNCRAMRALTWSMLPKIIEDTKRIIKISKYDMTGNSDRRATGESVLISTYMNVVKNYDMTDENITSFLKKYYSKVEIEEDRDESEEMLNVIYSYKIEVSIGKTRMTFTIKELLNHMYENDFSVFASDHADVKKEFNRRLCQHGVRLTKENHLAINNKSQDIMKITGKEHGYHKMFQRHNYYIEGNKNVSMLGDSPRCTIIDIFHKENKEFDDQIPF